MKKRNTLGFIIVIAALLVLWQLLSMLLHLPFLPSPINVIINTVNIFISKIAVHILYSLWRVFAGIALSLVIGVPIGMGMGYSQRTDRLLSPIVYFTYPIPKIALLPLVMLIFGLGDLSKILMIMMIVVFQIIVASRDAVKDIHQETFYSLISLGADKFAIFKRIIIPATLPSLFTSVRISLGTALSVLFFTETFGTQYGVGYFIIDSWTRINYIDMFSGILVMSVLGLVLFGLTDILERSLCRWKKTAAK